MFKHPSRQLLLNAIILTLMAYLILTIGRLRSAHCAPNIPPRPFELDLPPLPNRAPPPPPAAAPTPHRRTPAEARRARPLPACARTATRAHTYLMVFMGHSGSSAIMSELKQHPHVHFEASEPVDHQPVFDTPAALATTRAIFDRGIAQGKLPGFKIRPGHILANPDAWRALTTNYSTRIIWQYRKNIFKAAVGEYSYRYLNDTSSVEGLRQNITREQRCHIGAGCAFRIGNFSFLHLTLRNLIRSQRLITRAVHELVRERGCVRELPYEDYLYGREEALEDVHRFLGLKKQQTSPERFKATNDNLCSVVENWDEVCANFYGCVVWQPMLEDTRNDCFCSFSSGVTKYCDVQNSS